MNSEPYLTEKKRKEKRKEENNPRKLRSAVGLLLDNGLVLSLGAIGILPVPPSCLNKAVLVSRPL